MEESVATVASPFSGYCFADYELDLTRGRLTCAGKELHLRYQSYQLLRYFVERPGMLISKDELAAAIWNDISVTDNALVQCVAEIRKELNDDPRRPRFIATIPKFGYRFIGNVEKSPLKPQAAGTENGGLQPVGALSAASALTAAVGPQWLTARNSRWYAAAVLTGLVVASLLLTRHFRAQPILPPNAGQAAPVALRSSVAVFGFRNLTGDPKSAWLSTALSDWLSADLAAGDQLRAIPAEDVARTTVELGLPEGESLGHESLTRIRGNLGTDLVVIGSYARFGSKADGELRVDIRLQDTVSGETVSTISEAGTEAHLLELVSRAGEHLRASLSVQPVTPDQAAEVAVSLPSNPEAARLYAEGLSRLRAFDALGARDLLQKAIAVEPGNALPHSALATALLRLGYDATATAEAKKATELTSHLPRAERSLVQARYFEVSRNWPQAIEAYRLLFDFFPDRIDYGLALAHAEISGGKGKDAEETIAALRKLPPYLSNDPSIDLADANAAVSVGDLKGALGLADQAAEKARSLGASLALAHALTLRADVLRNFDRLDEAAAAANGAKQIFAAVGDKGEFAHAQAITAHLLDLQGDFTGARKTYEVSLSTFREIGDRDGVARELNNIAVELEQLGDLKGSLRNFEDSLAICSELQSREEIAIEKANIGEILLALGDLNGAEQSYRQSLDISQAANNTDLAAHDLEGLGRDLQAQGRLEEARQDEDKAISVFAQGGQTQVIDAYTSLSGILLDMGKGEDAAAAARKASDLMEKLKSPDRYLTESEAARARVLLADGKYSEARKVMEQTTRIAGQRMNRESEFIWAMIDARVRAASANREDKVEAARRLRLVVAETMKAGFVLYEFEARLVLAQTEIALGNRDAGRADLSALGKEVSAKGFGIISRKATTLLQFRSSTT
jgi:DNA-binding winged helix-turn-helix (wHTH) protein/tetratricopeptide (TPR) repeat protein/TolB-like protein